MTEAKVLYNLKRLIGEKFNAEEIICAFENFEKNGVTEVIVNKSNNSNYDYLAYINTENSTQFLIKTDDKDIIQDTWVYYP